MATTKQRLDKIEKNEDWLFNYALLLEKVFNLPKRKFNSKREYWRWYYHNRIKVDGEKMIRRRMECQRWRLKQI